MYGSMIISLMGGLGLFLYGMHLMGEGLERVAGDRLRGLLEILTKNRLMGVLVGAGFTMIIQSSSATTVMVVGFVNAGLMNLLQATGVIMGANFGTSITAQIAAFDLSKVAPILLLMGVVMILFIKKPIVQRMGIVVAGFGILFVGMGMMSDAMVPLRTDAGFKDFLYNMAKTPPAAVLVGVLVTVVIQSSSASIVLVQLMAAEELIPLEIAFYICLGCAIGTCITAMLASIGASKTAKRAAVVHLLYNVFGSTLMALVITLLPFADWMQALSSDGNIMRMIANGMMIMKLTEIIIFFPLAKQLVFISYKLVPGEDPVPEECSALYLDERLLDTPTIAISQAMREIERMGEVAVKNLDRALEAFSTMDDALIEKVAEDEKLVNYLNQAITAYLVRISQEDITPNDSKLVGSFYHVINDLERVSDHAENIAEYAGARKRDNTLFSKDAMRELQEIRGHVITLLNLAMEAFHSRDKSLLPRVVELEDGIDEEEKRLQQAHIDRLSVGLCTPQSGMVYSDMLSNLERVADHATNIAFSIDGDRLPELPKDRASSAAGI